YLAVVATPASRRGLPTRHPTPRTRSPSDQLRDRSPSTTFLYDAQRHPMTAGVGRGAYMAEQVQDLPRAAAEPQGGHFLFLPVGSTPFMTPERFTEEQRQFFATGVDFVNSEVLPLTDRLERKDNASLRELLAKAGALGLLGVDVPEEFDGLGQDKTTSMLVGESQAGYGSWATTFGAHVGIDTLPI